MRVEDIMKRKPARIITVRQNESIAKAAQILKDNNIGALVVKDVCRTEGNVTVGMLTERDIVRALAANGANTLKMQVSALMAESVLACSPRDSLEDVKAQMTRLHVTHLPVFDQGTVIGVISLRDIVEFGDSQEQNRVSAVG